MLATLMFVAQFAPAATIWSGPNIVFTHSAPTGDLQDQLVAGVRITRGGTAGLYNSVTETGATSGTSPADTAWAVGTLANYNTLTYGPCPLEAGHHPPGFVGTTFVVHLIAEDIYLQLTLNAWGGAFETGDRSFTYTRSTPAAVAPTVTVTNPVSGTVFAAPANVTISADAAVSGGTVTNVQFFTNNISIGSVTTAPFKLTANNLVAGSYALKAAATAGGISTTSAVVNVSVVNPTTVVISAMAKPSPANFTFNYTSDSGLCYIIQRSTNLLSPNWLTLVTNTATSNPTSFADPNATANPGFYRVGRLPNP
ncbi:MAG: hypothetical protein JF609_03405 [Verrucomicrobia bacterium]|nr:hypothetical protein [Verrucomicrobiota bacterium]